MQIEAVIAGEFPLMPLQYLLGLLQTVFLKR
jgi:hypothetical protein